MLGTNKIWAKLQNPDRVINLAVAVVSIFITVFVSLYFYNKSILAAKIAYRVDQIRVFDQSQLETGFGDVGAPLYVVDVNGNKINSNVFAATVKIWNAGNDELRRDAVRKTYVVTLGSQSRRISAMILRQTSDTQKFKVDDKLSLEWEHFDAGEGFMLRLIYTAQEQQEISLIGSAVKVSPPQNGRGDYEQTNKPFNSRTIPMLIGFLFVQILCVVGFLILIRSMSRILRHEPLWTDTFVGSQRITRTLFISLIASTVFIAWTLYRSVSGLGLTPPF